MSVLSMERFWSKVEVLGPDDCWEWKRSTRRGYGFFWLDGCSQQAHRVAYLLTHGEWPDHCLHSCDNPPCCNPRHLRSGTNVENSQDSMNRGRHWAQREREKVRQALSPQ